MKALIQSIIWINLFALLSCGGMDAVPASLLLENGWKVKVGDSLRWSQQVYQDSSWDTVAVGNKEGPKIFDRFDGFAWYRTSIFLPMAMKENSYPQDSLKLFLGKIDDCDQVFLNGMILGENNKILAPGAVGDSAFKDKPGLWNIDRAYVLAVNDPRIFWGKNNRIAIRVYDKYGGGGLYGGIPTVGMQGLEGLVVIDSRNFYKLDSSDLLDRTIGLKNRSLLFPVSGTLIATAINSETGKEVFYTKKTIKLDPGESKKMLFELPVSTDPTAFRLLLSDDNSHMAMNLTCSIPYVLSR